MAKECYLCDEKIRFYCRRHWKQNLCNLPRNSSLMEENEIRIETYKLGCGDHKCWTVTLVPFISATCSIKANRITHCRFNEAGEISGGMRMRHKRRMKDITDVSHSYEHVSVTVLFQIRIQIRISWRFLFLSQMLLSNIFYKQKLWASKYTCELLSHCLYK